MTAGQDVLRYARQPSLDAFSELIWNGLDAEAQSVRVEYDTANLTRGRDTATITRISITDDGHGMTADRAESDFLSHGDSWKKTLNGRTANGLRVIHGSQGRGRFFAYSLGHHVTWTSVYEVDGKRFRLRLVGTARPDQWL